MSARLAEFARQTPQHRACALTEAAERAPRAQLTDALRRHVESTVEEAFEQHRAETLAAVEDQWHRVASRFRARVQQRVDAARQAAANLFDVPLPRLHVPELAGQRDQFSFLFVRVGSTTEPLSRAASRLVPPRWARRRALARARTELAAEFDKHAGRVRWDLAQRLDAARLELQQAMRTELDGSIAAIVEAAERARHWQAEDDDHRNREELAAGRLQLLGSSLTALAGAAT